MPQHSPLLWQPKERRRPIGMIAAAAAGAVLLVGAFVFFALSGDETAPTEASAERTPEAAPSAPAPSVAAPAPSPPPNHNAKVVPPPTPPAPSAAPAREGLDACVARIFGDGAFEGELPSFAFICKQKDPRKSAVELAGRIIYAQRGKGGVTDAMREWSILNWYELAVVAMARSACCTDPPPLDTGAGEMCKLDEALIALGAAGASGTGIDEAIKTYDSAVQCLINFKVTAHYKQRLPTYGPERDAFKRMAARLER